MRNEHFPIDQIEINTIAYARLYIETNYSQKQIKSITPYSFTIGSNNNDEGLNLKAAYERTLFFGHLYININPNENPLSEERIEIKYRSYFNHTPYFKTITRFVEKENIINENSSSIELFDSLEVTQQSLKYDFYLTFIGYKIDLI